MNAYRPRGTNIEVYARIINQEDSCILLIKVMWLLLVFKKVKYNNLTE